MRPTINLKHLWIGYGYSASTDTNHVLAVCAWRKPQTEVIPGWPVWYIHFELCLDPKEFLPHFLRVDGKLAAIVWHGKVLYRNHLVPFGYDGQSHIWNMME